MSQTQSAIRQHFHEECEAGVNKQINMELFASYTYLSMAYHFDRDDTAFPGLFKYFKHQSDEEREHAQRLMAFQNARGGRLVLQPVQKPARDDWQRPLDALQAALELERAVNQALLQLHEVASKHNDPHMADFIETHYLGEQVESIKELGEMVTRLKRCGSGLGEYTFDKDLQS